MIVARKNFSAFKSNINIANNQCCHSTQTILTAQMSTLSAANIISGLDRLDQTVWQAIHNGTILTVMKKEKCATVRGSVASLPYINPFQTKVDLFRHAESADAEIKQAFKSHSFLRRFIVEWKENHNSTNFIEDQCRALCELEQKTGNMKPTGNMPPPVKAPPPHTSALAP